MKIIFPIIFLFAIVSCQKKQPIDYCAMPVNFQNIVSDSTQMALKKCGKLDSLDQLIIISQNLEDIVNTTSFQNKLYTIGRLSDEYRNFIQTPRGKRLKVGVYIETKHFVESDWSKDAKLVRIYYGLNQNQLIDFKKLASPNLNFNEIMKLLKQKYITEEITSN